MNQEQKIRYFLKIFKKAENKYKKSSKRLSAEGWSQDWQVLIATIMSAQSRDETTIPIAEQLFQKYLTLKQLAEAFNSDVLHIFKSLNYNRTKAKNVVAAARFLVENYNGKVPQEIAQLQEIPGVGRKTANLVLSEIHKQQTITVDTHVHQIANSLGLVKTKLRDKTELELQKIVPKSYWNRINRIFVLWGKDVPSHKKEKLLKKLDEK